MDADYTLKTLGQSEETLEEFEGDLISYKESQDIVGSFPLLIRKEAQGIIRHLSYEKIKTTGEDEPEPINIEIREELNCLERSAHITYAQHAQNISKTRRKRTVDCGIDTTTLQRFLKYNFEAQQYYLESLDGKDNFIIPMNPSIDINAISSLSIANLMIIRGIVEDLKQCRGAKFFTVIRDCPNIEFLRRYIAQSKDLDSFHGTGALGLYLQLPKDGRQASGIDPSIDDWELNQGYFNLILEELASNRWRKETNYELILEQLEKLFSGPFSDTDLHIHIPIQEQLDMQTYMAKLLTALTFLHILNSTDRGTQWKYLGTVPFVNAKKVESPGMIFWEGLRETDPVFEEAAHLMQSAPTLMAILCDRMSSDFGTQFRYFDESHLDNLFTVIPAEQSQEVINKRILEIAKELLLERPRYVDKLLHFVLERMPADQ